MLLILVDELGKDWMESTDPHTKNEMKAQTLARAMDLMDCHANVAFIFSALTEQNVERWRSNSGRVVYQGAKLTLFDQQTVEKALEAKFEDFDRKENAIRLLKSPRIQAIIRQCFGHPR